MSYVSLEAAVEAMLKTAFQTRLTTAGLTTTSIKTFWNDESGAATRETRALLAVNIAAAPNVPQGWQTPERMVYVDVEILTQTSSDPVRATLKTAYDAIRTSIDADEFSSVSITTVTSVVVGVGGGVLTEGPWNLVRIPLEVNVCVA